MRTLYQSLFRVWVRHTFYVTGQIRGDLVAVPSALAQRTLARLGLVFRPLEGGWGVYAEVAPDTSPRRLLRSLGGDGLRLTFLLLPANPHLWNISELPGYRPGTSLFYFDNLRLDQEAGRLHLGDSVADARVGDAVPLVTGEIYVHRFAAPVRSATITLADRFGKIVASDTFSLPDSGASTSEHRLDLTKVGRLAPGRYTASDDHGGSAAFYYDPEIFGDRPFGIVEIFSRTDRRTPDGHDLVPPAYRFLAGDELIDGIDYSLQFDSRATTWRYNVVKKYSTDGFALADLEITGDMSFTKTLGEGRAVFTSTEAVRLAESRRALALTVTASGDSEGDGERVRDLPNPAATTPLSAVGSPPAFHSEMYVYV